MIFWNEFDNYTIIEDRPLRELAEEYNTTITVNNKINRNTRDWFNYAHIMAVKHDFNVIYEACFIYYVTLYFSDEGISAGAEEDYFLNKLDTKISSMYFRSTNEKVNERDQKVYFFNSLLSFFTGDEIKGYERKVFQHNIRVSNKIRKWFEEHGNVRDTIISLIEGSIEKPHLNMNDDTDGENITFLLSYSYEKIWRNLSSMGDGDRLRILLY